MFNESFLIQVMWISVPILFGCLGTIYSEKAGMLNLGTEGIMMTSAVASFLGAYQIYEKTSNAVLAAIVGILIGMLAGVLLNLLYGILTIIFKTNQTVTGLTLTILGVGIGNFIGKANVSKVLDISVSEVFRGKAAQGISIPLLSKIPFFGNVIFSQNLFFYIGVILVILSNIYFYKTKFGLYLKAVGDNPASAESVSINVNKYKFIHLIIAGAIISLSGSFFMLGYNNTKWLENVTNGYGWIAVALVIFASWKPTRALLGSILFGGLLLSFTLNSNPDLMIVTDYSKVTVVILLILTLASYYFKKYFEKYKLKEVLKKPIKIIGESLALISIVLMISGYKNTSLIVVGIVLYSISILILIYISPNEALGIGVLMIYILLCLSNKDYLKMAPYLITVMVLCAVSIKKRLSNKPPQSLGVSYFREER